ncbi:MAG: toxin-antitoxin system HicB family antitoxin [Dehalococcoidia bacterium]
MRVRIENILEAFDHALELVEDEHQRDRFSRVIAASRASVERAVDDLVAEVTSDINEALGDDVQVDLSYGADGISVDVTQAPSDDDDDADETLSLSEGETEKLTLRLPAELKDRATGAAAEAGYSLNAWIVRVLARELSGDRDGRRRRSRRGRGRRADRGRGAQLRGWIGS